MCLILIPTAKEILFALGTQQPRLSRPNFHVYIEQLTEGMKLREFEEFSEYLMTSVKVGSPLALWAGVVYGFLVSSVMKGCVLHVDS